MKRFMSEKPLMRDRKAVKWCYILNESSCVYSKVMYLSYLLLHWQSWWGTKNEKSNVTTYDSISIDIYIYIYIYIYIMGKCICIMFYFLIFKNRPNFREMTTKHNHRCHQNKALFYFVTFTSIYIKPLHYEPKFKAYILHNLCYILGLYFASDCM